MDLPAGVVIDRIGLYFYDNDGANNIATRLQRYTGFTVPAIQTLGTVTSLLAPGSGYSTAVMPDHQVDNDASANGQHYSVLIDIPTANANLRFKAVELRYRRTVSVAPAVATFPNDVPISHPYFPFIEALAAAGVTGGCAAGSYCPDLAITRGEMAVFLAVALGLHFPN